MPESKNTFLKGAMNKDVDSRLIPKGQYRDALNFRIGNSENNDAGAGENSLSNRKLTQLSLGTNPVTIGMYGDEFEDKIYWFVKSDSGHYVLEWDNINELSSAVLADTRVGDDNILNLSEDYLITGVNVLIDSDNGNRFLLWTDGLNPPRQINIERAKSYGENGFGQDEISTYKKPPLSPPTLQYTDTASDQENNIEEKFLAFSYRYKYLDGEYSALSPFTEYAFRAKPFNYDYSTSSNESMVNNFSAVVVTFDTGDDLVEGIEVVFKESESTTVYAIESFNKTNKGWSDNTDVNFTYFNSKIDRVLNASELTRLYDNVPLTAYAQDLLGNRINYADYTENYNIEDCDSNPIDVSLILESVPTAITEGVSTTSMKSNRDYEVGIVYTKDGRLTTPLTSEGNTTYIGNSDCINQNKLKVTIPSLAPCFADKYRFFVKQSKTDYDTVIPTLFYQDGVYVWIKLEANEIDKIEVGEFLYVKADSSTILSEIVQTKVLEIKAQERNFLEDEGETAIKQLQGNYFKIKPTGFRISEDDFEFYEFYGYDNTRNRYDEPIRNNVSYIEDAIGYGARATDDMVSSGTYTGLVDIRYIVEIEVTGTPDTFRWSNDDGVSWTSGVAITGAAQLLEEGVSVTFGTTTGHDIDDNWIVSAKSSSDNGIATDMNSKAYAIYKGIAEADTNGDKDVIEGGARINIVYRETGEGDINIERSYISSRRYANLEEWFYGDSISLGISDSRIWFRRGGIGNDGAASYITIDKAEQMNMIIRSVGTQNNDADNIIKVYPSITIFQSENDIIFETKPLDSNLDIFYEVGRTYDISEEGYHLGFDGGDISQTASLSAEITLPLYNCFSWGNGFESYKIKDLYNAKTMKIDTRPSSPIEDYRENRRISSITYGGVYEQSTNFNALNEFNLSLINYKDLDDKYGRIRKLHSRDTDLVVFQEDKVHKVLFNKSVLYNADGSGNVSQNLNVLGQEVPYAGEYGISNNPESFATYGNYIWFTDAKRGVVLRLGIDGLTEISMYDMQDWFRDNFIDNQNSKKLGAYDPYFDQYVLSLGEEPAAPTLVVDCGSNIFKTGQTEEFTYILKLNSLSGDISIGYNVTVGTATITAIFDGVYYQLPLAVGSGTFDFTRTTLLEDEVTVIVTPQTIPTEYGLSHTCPIGTPMDVVSIIINGDEDAGLTMTSRYKWDSSPFYSEVPVFEADGVTLFETNTGTEGLTRYPMRGSTIEVQAYKDYINDGNFSVPEENRLGYLISETEYSEVDLPTLLPLATFPTITTINEGGIPETNKISFTFNKTIDAEKLYLIWDYTSITINEDTYIYIYFDSSGSMDSTLAPLEEMRDTLLRDALLPFYNNDDDLYDSRVFVISQADERTIDMLNANGNEPVGNIVSMVFQDEASPVYYSGTFSDSDPRTAAYDTDISTFRGRLDGFDPTYYRGVVFQVNENGGALNFQGLVQAIENGTNNYAGTNGLSDKTEVIYKYNITDGGTAEYYLEQVTDALTELGFDLNP